MNIIINVLNIFIYLVLIIFLSFFYDFKIKMLGDSLKEGDVLLSNHPSAGGTHLPDLTVITPVNINFHKCFFFSFFL